MSDTVIKIEDLSKIYRLGEVGTGTLSHDLNRWWAKMRGKEDPFATVGQVNDRTQKAESDYVYALKDINLEVKQGEVLGIIGKNGAGKSTLLKILSRITTPSTGNVKVKGRIASLLEVGTGMNPEMTGRENIYLNGAIMGMSRHEINRKFDEIVDFAGCEMYVDTPVKRYSSGMRVRLGFAVAAFLEPEILIVDEVLAVGDAEFQKKAIGKMKDVATGEGRTVLFVSHNMQSVQSLCSRGVILSKGQVSYHGDADACITSYLQGVKNTGGVLNKFDLAKGEINVSISFTSQNFQLGELPSGKDFCVNVSFSKLPVTIQNAGIGIGINDRYGNRLLTYHSKVEINDKLSFSDKTKIKIRESFNKLVPGEYPLVFSIFEGEQAVLSWKDFGMLRVTESNVYDTGRMLNSSYQGNVLSNAEWEIL